jgi:hypothetical protein
MDLLDLKTGQLKQSSKIEPVFVGSFLRVGGEPPMASEALFLEQSTDKIGVADIDRQQHGPVPLMQPLS